MSKSNEFLVGAFGMKAKKPGESMETTAGAKVSRKSSMIASGSRPSGVMSPSILSIGISMRLPKSSGTGSISRRSRQ
jgi:hypothetical protein